VTPQLFLIMACAVLGLIFGSFANVLVYRLPREESIVFPSSHCPACGHSIAWYDNIPLLSYIRLGGRCRHCGDPVPMRYFLLELCMGATWAYLAWHFGWGLALVSALILATLLWALTWIDLEKGLLPDAITVPGIALGMLFASLAGHGLASLIGAVSGYGIFWLVAKLFLAVSGREGMGHGDFKLLAMLGAFFGWQALPAIIFVSSFSGAVCGGLYLLLARRHARTPIPFGPYLAAAGMVWLLWGEGLMSWYFGFFQNS